MNLSVKAAVELARHNMRHQPRSAAARIYDDLRQRILSLELPPGASLLRAELAQRYDVSQTPLRDALQRLEQDGLVEIFPQSRTLVTRIDATRVQEAQFLRVALETEVVRRLARKGAQDVVDFGRAVIELQRSLATDRSQLQLFQEMDEYFHGVLFGGLQQDDLHALVRSRSGHLDRVRRLQTHAEDKIREILQGHERIVAAIEARDEDAAVEAIRVHLHKEPDWVNSFRAEHQDYFS
ncbi:MULTISPECIES: GntR family transcriptional regulator [Paracoccus]|jgi:DNA-binding GntR family transcriptional regulator|uniref:GntR family transcriptional regulator n=1 Tax=Paracoccus litorisediminis TaxID=2006130 RepID=A0A844HIW2_9RHOB|nr:MULTISPECIES: GntR family transcriptional regulator [Paracoccus]MBD9528810.1 GntR family transcriptional regulator [Paracoccus sp. PAR01]MTH60103.1 GntR family transcriptional regulator [Paracoccus litorisediminis]